jgi:hypothetical protein
MAGIRDMIPVTSMWEYVFMGEARRHIIGQTYCNHVDQCLAIGNQKRRKPLECAGEINHMLKHTHGDDYIELLWK